ncbi:protein CYSTEINE-RICH TRANSMEMBRANE MODULE 7-like [Phragmites australis]|uniref:protein CYSTEINE-RICH TRANSMEMBRANE MODULE 7-like n=1 Tax=Phragmites australis TaxID=29695 RepID=UPI002D769C14|nr:protein CYSTEINE-RICH TRANSMEMBRANE MODULE 7-like [Phragmites australis]
MKHSMQGSRDSYAPQVHSLYPHPQPRVYPPPPNPQGYQTYLGEDNSSYGWSEQQTAPSQGPFLYGYQDDADCVTFLRGCFAGLCCCCLLGQCCL